MTTAPASTVQRAEQLKQLAAAQRLLKAREARNSLIAFTEFTMPDPNDPDDPGRSRYDAQYFHKALAAALEEVEGGRLARLIITFPPRHGKSQLTSRQFPAWALGRDPYRHIMVGTYNQPFADDFGKDVRTIMELPQFRTVFPNAMLKKGRKSTDSLGTEAGGVANFVGRGGSATGRGADILIIDDPTKDRQEANSETTRNEVWDWFNDVVSTRLMSDTGAIIIIQCMTGDTPVLMETGREKPLRDIRPGDRVATYEGGKLTASTVRNWASQGPDLVFTIRMKSGITVRANARHPFLVDEGGKSRWLRTDSLKKGDQILRVTGASGRAQFAPQMSAASPPSARACAPRTTTSAAGQPAFAHLRSILGPAVNRTCAIATELTSQLMKRCWPNRAAFALYASAPPQSETLGRTGAKSSVSTIATKRGAFAAFSATTATLRLATEKLRRSFARPLTTYGIGRDTVLEVVESGIEDVFDIQIDRTENFIANGLVSHNTRWHEDDLIGRLTDPMNPHFNAEEAAQWKIINIKAIADEDDVLARKPGEALWPERFGLDFLLSFKRRNPVGFSALYQQEPTPADGEFFRREHLTRYNLDDQPRNLRIYAASDHAVATKQQNDRTCLLIAGVDSENVIWLLDAWWKRAKTDVVAEAMIELQRKWKPLIWAAERGQITQSIGPFLRRRMREEEVYINLRESPAVKDKMTRAQSIQGRCSQGMVRFPAHRPWCSDAIEELLKFPQGRFDDFVDAFAHLGMLLSILVRAANDDADEHRPKAPKVGTLGWIKAAGDAERRERQRVISMGGM